MALEQGKQGLDEGFKDAAFASNKRGPWWARPKRRQDNGYCGGTGLSGSVVY